MLVKGHTLLLCKISEFQRLEDSVVTVADSTVLCISCLAREQVSCVLTTSTTTTAGMTIKGPRGDCLWPGRW